MLANSKERRQTDKRKEGWIEGKKEKQTKRNTEEKKKRTNYKNLVYYCIVKNRY